MNKEIENLFEHLEMAYADCDFEQIVAAHHSENIIFNASKNQLKPVLNAYKLKVDFLDLQVLEDDGNIVVLRLQQQTVKVQGPEFNNNIIDMVNILKHENGKYKILSSAPISTKLKKEATVT